tara:strand:- start:154 stop:738 length:585 start_codon:yes stop_codon:yes gene_type:complete
MKNLIMTAAAIAVLSTAALAEDYDNTSITMAAEGAEYGVELSTNDTSRSVGVYTTNRVLDFGLGMNDNGTNRDFNLSVGNTVGVPIGLLGTAYAKGEIEYNWGDTFTKDEIHITPAAGFKTTVAGLAPFGEVGYRLKSVEGDFTDVNRDAPYAKIGTSYQVTANTALKVDLTQSMNTDWKSTDRELGAKLTFKF